MKLILRNRMISFVCLAFFFSGTASSARDLPGVKPQGIPVFLMERYYSAPQSQKEDPPLRVGDVLRFRWIGEAKPSSSIVEIASGDPEKSLSSLGWEVYAHPKDDPTSAFSVIPLQAGKVELPALALVNAQGAIEGFTQPLQFQVEPAVSPEESKKKAPDYLPPVSMRFPLYRVIAMITFILISIGIGVAFWFRKKAKRGQRVDRLRKVQVTPEDQEALELLDKLNSRSLWKTGQFKPHYFGISETLKKYIERRYSFEAAESTTRELLRGLSNCGVEQGTIDSLSILFERLDRVKFTDFIPPDGESLEVLQQARSWILATRKPKSNVESAHEV